MDLIECSEIHNKKIIYETKPNSFYESLSNYLNIAKRIISYFVGKYSPKLCKQMLSSEDAISHVAHAIMMADWRWDENKGRTRHSYRNQCAIWAIQKYFKKNKKLKVLSLNHLIKNETEFHSMVPDNRIKSGEEQVIADEEWASLVQDIDNVFLTQNLTNKQQDYIRKVHLEGMSYREVAEQLGITQQAVRQVIKKGKEKLAC